MKKKLNVWKYYLAAFVIPVVIACVVFAFMGIAPFGNHNLLMSDLATQYMPFFKMLRDELIHHTFAPYSFMFSIGDNMVPIYTYYLMSPLNLLVAFVKVAHIPILISVIILIKIGLIGWAMSFFLKVKYQCQDIVQIMAAVAYALSGFVALYFYDFMWLDALIVLPLLVLSIERLFYQGKWGCYVASLAYIIIVNYYMGYMLCIFSVIYFVYLVFLNRPEHTGFWSYLKVHSQMTWKFVISSVIGGLLSAWMLIPSVVGMLSTSKGLFDWTTFLPYPKFSPSVFVSLGVGANNYTGRLFHNPSLFVGTIFILGMLLFWISKQIPKRDKHASIWLVGAIFVGMWISTFNTVWHMLQNPAGFPYREAFMLGFVLIMFAYEAYIKGAFKNTKNVLTAGLIDGGLLVFGYICANVEQNINNAHRGQNQFFTGNTKLVWALVFLVVVLAVIALANKFGKNLWYGLFAILCVEMGMNFYFSLEASPIGTRSMTAPFGNQEKFEKSYTKSDKIIKKINKKSTNENNFSREAINNKMYAKSFGAIYNQYNDSLMFDYRGVSGYSSTLNMNTQSLLSKLGFSSRNVRRINFIGATAITRQLLHVSNQINISQNGKTKVISTPNNDGLGMSVSPKVSKIKYSMTDIIGNLNKLVQAEAGDKQQYLNRDKVSINSKKKQMYKTPDPFQSGKILDVNGFKYELSITPKVSGPLYMYIPSNMIETYVKVDGKEPLSPYKMLGTEMVEMNNAKKDQKVKVQLIVPKKLKNVKNGFASLDIGLFNKFDQDSQQYVFRVNNPKKVKLNGSKFTGTVKTTKQRPTVMLSMPYDSGWKAESNGKNLKVKKVAGGLTGVTLKPGTHKVNFRFRVPGKDLGLLLTLIGIIGAFSQAIYYRRKRK